MPNIDISIVLI